MFTISKRFSFSASHVLDHLPKGHPCARLHGHNYEIEVVLAAESLDGRGFVFDYRDLDAFKRLLDQIYDHRHLNEVMPERTTAENLAHRLFHEAQSNLGAEGASKLYAVRVSETPKTWAEYRP